MTATVTVPCVAAHLLAAGVLRFLPTDADTVCETCDGDTDADDHPCAKSQSEHGSHCNCSMTQDICHWCGLEWLGDGEVNCPDCAGTGRRSLRAGDRIAIRADDNVPGHCEELGRWMVTHKGDGTIVMYDTRAGRNYYGTITLSPGEVVGYATVTNVLPIVGGIPPQDSWREPWRIITTEPWPVVTSWPGYGSAHPEVALVDHVDAGLVFTPGGVALELDAEAAR